MTRLPQPIESADNPRFKRMKRVLSGRGIRKEGSALVPGARFVTEAVAAMPNRCLAWITIGNQPAPPPGLPDAADWLSLPPRLFREIDVLGTGAPLLWVSTPALAPWQPPEPAPGCTLLVPFQDPENVGAVTRSAVAFGVGCVVLLEGCAHPFHPRAIRASGGAVFRAPLVTGPAIDDLPGDVTITALSGEGRDIDAFTFPPRFVLLPGVEGPGLPGRLRKGALSITTTGAVESLNAATATAIALYLWSRARDEGSE
jgi:tRNA G18 (ribose-2'-O)-methylase SpoU